MKKTAFFILGAATLSLASCSDSGNGDKEPVGGGHSHGDGQGEAEHSHDGGGHMEHMNDVREWLKEELGDEYDQVVPEATEQQLAEGKKIYSMICIVCHGESGKGDGPGSVGLVQKPADFTDPAHSKFYSDRGRLHIIQNGVKETPMVGWSAAFNEEQILSIYTYVRSLRSEEEAGGQAQGDGKFVCPMHPAITADTAVKCSKCGMKLELKKVGADHRGSEKKDDGHSH